MSRSTLPDSIVDRLRAVEQAVADMRNRVPTIPGMVVNSAGQVYFPGGLVVGGGGSTTHITSPSTIPAPTNLVLTPQSDDDSVWIDVSWDAPAGYSADQVSRYLVRWKRHTGQIIAETMHTAELGVSLRNLVPLTQYDIEVYASTILDKLSDPLSGSTTTLGDTSPPGPVEGIIVETTIGAVSARWDDNPEVDVAQGVGSYELQVDSATTFDSNGGNPDFSQIIKGTAGSFVGLETGTDYYLRVRAYDNSLNVGPWSPVDTPSPGLAYIEFHSDPFPGLNIGTVIGGGNVLDDSSFESPDFHLFWTEVAVGGTGLAQTNLYNHGIGTKSVQFYDADVAGHLYMEPISAIICQAGDNWVLSFWVKRDAVGSALGLEIRYNDGLDTATTVFTDIGTGDWVRRIYTFTVPAGKTSLKPRFYLGTPGSNSDVGAFFLDEVQLELGQIATGYAPKSDELLPGTVSGEDIVDGAITSGKLDYPSTRNTPTTFLVHAGSGNEWNGVQFSGSDGDLHFLSSNFSVTGIGGSDAFSGFITTYDGLWDGTGAVPLINGPNYRGLGKGHYKAIFFLKSTDTTTAYKASQRICKVAVHHASSSIVPETDQYKYVIAQELGVTVPDDGTSTGVADGLYHAISIPFHVTNDMSSTSGIELYLSSENSQITGQSFNMRSRKWGLSHIVVVTFDALVQNQIVSEYIAALAIQTGHLQASSVVADKVAAGAITTEKLTVGNVGDSMILNGGFEDASQASATRAANVTYDYEVSGTAATYDLVASSTIGGSTGAKILKVTLPGTSGTSIALNSIPVTPGDQWYVSALAADDRAGSNRGSFYLRTLFGTTKDFARTDPGVQVTDIVAGASITSPMARQEGTVTIPANVSWMRVALYNWIGVGSGSHSMYFDDVSARKVTVTAQIADDAITAQKVRAGAIVASKLSVTAGGGNHVLNSSFEDINASSRGASGIGDTGFLNWDKYTSGAGSAPTTTRVTTTTKHGLYAARLQWTTNGGYKGITQSTPVGANGTTVWPANSTSMISMWVYHNTATVGTPSIPADNTGFTDSWIVQPAAVQGVWQRYIMKRVVGASTVTSKINLAFTHANGDLFLDAIQVEEGDVATGYAVMPDELLPGTVQATYIVAGALSSASGVFGTVDASTINAGTILAARLGNNTYPIGIITSSTLSTANITINGGSLKAGNPPTTGLLLNSQGLTLYSGGVPTVTLDATTGNAGFTGTVVATAGQLQTLDVTGTLTMQTGGLFRTRTSTGNPGIEFSKGNASNSEISFYTGDASETNRGFLQVNSAASLQIAAPASSLFGLNPGQIRLLGTNATIGTTARDGATFRNSGSDDLWNNIGHHGSLLGSTGIISFGGGYNGYLAVNAGSSPNSEDTAWGLSVFHPRVMTGVTFDYSTTLQYSSDGSGGGGNLFNRAAGIVDVRTNVIVAYAANDDQFYYASSEGIKSSVESLEEGSLDKIKNLRPVRHKMKNGGPDEFIGLIAEEVRGIIPEAAPQDTSGVSPGISPAAMIATLVHAMQEQQDQIEELKGKINGQ